MEDFLSYQVFKKNELRQDDVAVEIPVQLILNNEPLTISMCSPSKPEQWAIGILFTEGFIQAAEDITSISITEKEHVLEIQVEVEHVRNRLNSMSLLSVTACGMCGKTSFEAVNGSVVTADFKEVNVSQLIQKLSLVQPVFSKTGATHAAGVFGEDLNLLSSSEDVGRHNAVDKCIGELLQLKRLKEGKILVVTSRVSYEIVAKAFKANFTVIVAVSAPTSLAIDFCKELGIQLIGFVRGEHWTKYS